MFLSQVFAANHAWGVEEVLPIMKTRRSTGIFLALIIAAFAFRAQPARAQFTPAGDDASRATLRNELHGYPYKTLFESYDHDNWDLFIMNADGTQRRNVMNTPDLHEMYAQASPDGSKICYVQEIEKDGDTLRSVYYMNADGTGRVKVADQARQPCWSPDGRTIAFLKQEFTRFRVDDFATKGIYFYDVATGKTRPHPNDKIQHLYNPTWSPDGKWIVATVHGGMGYSHAILAIAVDGMDVFNLHIGGCRPCISPDGTRITWGLDDHTIAIGMLHLSRASCSVSDIKHVAHHTKMHLYHADFSPDGKYVTFSVGPGGRTAAHGPGTHTHVAEIVGVRARWDLYVNRSDGTGGPVQLTHTPQLSNKESEWTPSFPIKKHQ